MTIEDAIWLGRYRAMAELSQYLPPKVLFGKAWDIGIAAQKECQKRGLLP